MLTSVPEVAHDAAMQLSPVGHTDLQENERSIPTLAEYAQEVKDRIKSSTREMNEAIGGLTENVLESIEFNGERSCSQAMLVRKMCAESIPELFT